MDKKKKKQLKRDKFVLASFSNEIDLSTKVNKGGKRKKDKKFNWRTECLD